MRKVIYILIGIFILCSTNSYGQFWRKKNNTASGKSGSYEAPKHKDAFSGKHKKGPNIYSSKPPRTKSKSKLYKHSISKKAIKKNKGSVFSTKKRRYKSVVTKPKGGGDSGGTGSSRGGRKSGKGRKKE